MTKTILPVWTWLTPLDPTITLHYNESFTAARAPNENGPGDDARIRTVR
jgi:hypothetical protein